MNTILAFDRGLQRCLVLLCSLMLVLMVGFTCYTVVMRTVFDDPPFWGDTMALFANVWLVMLAFSLSIRERASISMQMIYNYLPAIVVRWLEGLWLVMFVLVGLMMVVLGYQVAIRIPGAYWELGNLSKSVPMMILPISGALVVFAALLVLFEDLRGGEVRAGSRNIPTEIG